MQPKRWAASYVNAARVAVLRRQGVSVGDMVHLNGAPIVSLAANSSIKLGARVVLTSQSRRTALGVNHPVVLRTLCEHAAILIEDDVGISGGTICAMQRVHIGQGSLLGANVTIADTDFHVVAHAARRYLAAPAPREQDEVIIGRNAFIGAGSTILKGVSLGDDVVVGAGSVVTASFPPGAVVAGSPARLVRVWR